MTPELGRIVTYKIDSQDAEYINRRRADARVKFDWHRENKTGSVVHVGNNVLAGDVFPLVITRVWPSQDGLVNGQLLLDGNDTLWVTSAKFGPDERQWWVSG